MKRIILKTFLLLTLIISIACEENPDSIIQEIDDNPDMLADSIIPQFVDYNYIELEKIDKISKFRSGIGHDYSDDFESCRSMKHYFVPKENLDWSTVKLFSPVEGKVIRVYDEWAGTQIQIASDLFPQFVFVLFHINTTATFNVGDSLYTGQFLGTHISDVTFSDIAVNRATAEGRKLVSIFEVMTDSLFQEYNLRGIVERDNLIITKNDRDSSLLICNGGTFNNEGALENWCHLN